MRGSMTWRSSVMFSFFPQEKVRKPNSSKNSRSLSGICIPAFAKASSIGVMSTLRPGVQPAAFRRCNASPVIVLFPHGKKRDGFLRTCMEGHCGFFPIPIGIGCLYKTHRFFFEVFHAGDFSVSGIK